MIESNKTYGFTIAVKELRETVPNIFRYASAYKRLKNITTQGLWEMFVEPTQEKEPEKEQLPEDDPNYKPPLPEEVTRNDPNRNTPIEIDPEAMEGEKYNMCHFWSNFEIARLSWFRSKEYEDFFQMMDRSGGFWMERVSFDSLTSALLFSESFGTFLIAITIISSGVTHLSTRSPPVFFSHRATSTTSVTLATATPRSSTVRPTRLHGSWLASPSWRRRRLTSARGTRRINTGSSSTPPRRMALVAAAAVTPISLMSRARTVAAWPNG